MKINNLYVNKILDSRGDWTIEVEIESNDYKAKASIPSGKSKGSYEAVCLSYEEIKKNSLEFLKEIKDIDFSSSQEFDDFLIKRAGKNKEKLGANFTLGLSIAFARILAKSKNLELFEYLKKDYDIETKHLWPRIVINIIGGGVHSFNNLDFQEYWIVSKDEFSENLIEKVHNVINNLVKILPKPLGKNDEGALSTNFENNLEPFKYLKEFEQNFELGSDIAANQIKNNLNWGEIFKKLKDLNVSYLEDPFKEEDFENFAELKKMDFNVIGDDLTATNIERLKIALDKDSINGVIVKPNQIGTIKETFDFVKLAKENNLFTIFSHRSGETNDYWIIDLGIAFEANYFKIGVPVQGERTAKWNRLLEITKKP